MSHQDNIKESSQMYVDEIETLEKNSLTTLNLPDSENTETTVSTHLLNPHNGPESSDGTASTSAAVDPNHRVILLELPDPRGEVADTVSLDLPISICDRSDSDAFSSTSTRGSSFKEDWFFLLQDSQASTPLPNAPENSDDTVSTSEAVDRINQVTLLELPDPAGEEADTIGLYTPRSTCGHFESEDGTESSTSSEEYVPYILRDREGFDWFIAVYEFRMNRLRQNGYLLPFEIICLAFALASCYMGAYNWPMCPADVYIPRYVFFNGAFATFAVFVEIMDSLWKYIIRHQTANLITFCSFGIGWIAIIMTLIEMIQFYKMSYSFHRNEENYCSEMFYWFVYYKNISFGVLTFLSALIYIPTFSIYYFTDGFDYGFWLL